MALSRFQQAKQDLDVRTAELEPDVRADLDHAFTRAAGEAAGALTASAPWNRPDADEVYDASALQAEIDRILSGAKTDLDASIRLKLGGAPAGDYDTRGVASRIAGWHRQQVQAALLDGWNNGESVDQVAETLAGIGQSSSLLVARTSLNGMNNSTSLAGAAFAGVYEKQWLTAEDDRVRESHEEIDGEAQPLSGIFTNGCRFPGDPNGPPEEVWNCRCTLVYPEPDQAEEAGFAAPPGYQSPSETLTGWDETTPIGATGRHVMDVIDRTHFAPGVMGRTPVIINQKGLGAAFHASIRETRMEVSEHAKWPNMTIAHEYGHKLDYSGSPGWFSDRKAAVLTMKNAAGEWVPLGPELSEAMADWMKAVRASDGYKNIETERAGYFKDVHELWARSYFQWLAVRSGDAALLRELKDVRSQAPGSTYYFPQWSDEDFTEIAAAIDRVMKERGLID